MVRVDDELNLATLSNIREPNLATPDNLYEEDLPRPSNPYKVAFYLILGVLIFAYAAGRHAHGIAGNRPVTAVTAPGLQVMDQPQISAQNAAQSAVMLPIPQQSQSTVPQQQSAADTAALALYEQLVTEEQNRMQEFLDGLRPESAEASGRRLPESRDTPMDPTESELLRRLLGAKAQTP